jgi:uncharacterized membrane protein YgcG
MANKAQKSWAEIQMAIAAISITATLGFWNVFAAPDRQTAVTQVKPTTTPPPPPPPTETAQPTPVVPTSTALALMPVKIIFGGKAPSQQVVQVVVPQNTKRNKGGGGDGGGGGGGGASVSAPAPAPAASTGSSKP